MTPSCKNPDATTLQGVSILEGVAVLEGVSMLQGTTTVDVTATVDLTTILYGATTLDDSAIFSCLSSDKNPKIFIPHVMGAFRTIAPPKWHQIR